MSRAYFSSPRWDNMRIDRITGRRKLRPTRANLLRHARKCHICHHPLRAEIEEDFLNWRGPDEIVSDYKLPHYSVIYRHANALGLRAHRNENIRTVLDILVEQAETVRVTGNTILRAMRAYSCLQDDGTWVELPKRIIYQTDRKTAAASRRISNRKSGIRIRRNLLKTNTRSQV
jgi:hypothetical protein